MADTKKGKNTKTKTTQSQLVGRQTEPTVLGDTTRLDIDTNKTFVDTLVDAGLSGGLNIGAIEDFTTISNSRDQIYALIDTMSQDSAVSSILRTYAEDVCDVADSGHIVWAESDDPNISKYVNYLLNVMNADKNVFKWAYCLLKYGDVYLKLYRESDYADTLFKSDNIKNAESARKVLNESLEQDLNEAVKLSIHDINDRYSGYVEMVSDPGTMFELTKYGRTYGYIEVPNIPQKTNIFQTFSGDLSNNSQAFTNYRMKSNDINVYQADDFVHACLDDGFDRYPEQVEIFTNDTDYNSNVNAQTYTVRRGKSLLYDSYKIWREKLLLENAVLLNRITRSSIVRKISVEVGDMGKEQTQQVLHRIKDMMEQKTAINAGQGMSEYNNPGPIENNIYFATHNGQGQISVEAVGGDIDVKNIADLDWWNNKFYSSYGIPKQYFGWTEDGAGFNGGTSLVILSSVYAKGVKRVQNALSQMFTDLINLQLINKGYVSYLNNFTIKMKTPLTQEELDYRSNFSERISAIGSLQGLFADVEDKSRRLEILKTLIGSLNYGDTLATEIENEIKATKEAERKAAEEAANEATAEDTNDLDLDLSSMEEKFNFNSSSDNPLLESDNLTIDTKLFENDDIDLPSPEEISDNLDMSKNI